jgi:hypothetical protein
MSWMMELGIISLYFHELGEHDSYLGGLNASYIVRTIGT